MNDNQCLVELDAVLEQLSHNDLNKIPLEVRNAIKEAKDKEYLWEYDRTKTLGEQNLNRKTIAMLEYLNMEYLLSREQKLLMQKIHDYYDKKNKEELRKKYNPDKIFNISQASTVNIQEKENVNKQDNMQENGIMPCYAIICLHSFSTGVS